MNREGTHFESLLEQAWSSRIRRELTETFLFHERLVELTSSEKQELECRILLASLLRAQGKPSESQNLYQKTISQALEKAISLSHWVDFETGIQAYLNYSYMKAHEAFSRFLKGIPSSSKFPKIIALYAKINQLLCLENLGLPKDQILTEVQLIAVDPEISSDPQAKDLIIQITWIQQRHYFFSGQWSELLRTPSIPPTVACHWLRWVQCLPWHINYVPFQVSELPIWMAPEVTFHDKDFRVRTLSGTWHSGDTKLASGRDQIQRLYLWTWRWMTAADSHAVEPLIQMVTHIWNDPTFSNQSPEHQALFRNALGWMLLLDPAAESSINSNLASLETRIKTRASATLELEWALIQTVRQLRDQPEADFASTTAWFQSQLGAGSEFLRWSEILNGLQGQDLNADSPVRELIRTLRELIQVRSGKPHSREVDVLSYTIRNVRTGTVTVSESLVKLIDALEQKDSLSFDQAVRICFGFRKYEHEIHRNRIYNLISRMKQFCGTSLDIFTRDETLICTGDWSSIRMIRPIAPVQKLREQSQWAGNGETERMNSRLKTGRFDRAQKAIALKNLETGMLYHRDDLIAFVGGSRATALRRVNQMIEKKILERIGHGPATLYRVVRPQNEAKQEIKSP